MFVYSNFNDFDHRDNAKFCSCGGDRQVYYWDVSTGRVIRKFRGHDGEVSKCLRKLGIYVALIWIDEQYLILTGECSEVQ